MFKQPKNYSEVLNRIFCVSFTIGLICTLFLGYISPQISNIINFSPLEINYIIKLNLVTVLIPLIVVTVFRIVLLHDRISDFFHIRKNFEINHILMKLAEGVCFKVTPENISSINKKHQDLMRDIFYKYAQNVDKTVINSQLIAKALDKWSWFWSIIESSVIIFISGIIAWVFAGFQYFLWHFFVLCIFALFAFLIYPSCKKATNREVDDILNDTNRKKEIKKKFNAL